MSRGGDRDFIEMTFRTVKVFGEDGKVNLEALDELVELAMRDGRVDGEEKAVLRKVLDRVESHTLSKELAAKVETLRKRFGL